MKQIIIGFLLISTFSAFAGEVVCTTLNTDQSRKESNEIVQKHLNNKCDTLKPFSISELNVDVTRICCNLKLE